MPWNLYNSPEIIAYFLGGLGALLGPVIGAVVFAFVDEQLSTSLTIVEPIMGLAFWRDVSGWGVSPARGDHGEFVTLVPSEGDAHVRVHLVTDRVLDDL